MYECEHCKKTYITERYYTKHFKSCRPLLRKTELETVVGSSAFKFFKRWLATKQCMNIEIETFISSRYYNSFIRFAKFIINRKIGDVDLYFNHVIKHKMEPTIWSNQIVYSSYLKMIDELDPISSIKYSIKTIVRLSRIFDCEPTEVSTRLYINEIIELLYSRHITPWFLLNCKDINSILTNPNITKDQHILLEAFINPKKWNKKFKKFDKEVIEIKEYLTNMDL